MFFITETGRHMRLVSRLSRIRTRYGDAHRAEERRLLTRYFLTAGNRSLDPEGRDQQLAQTFHSLEREMSGLFSKDQLRIIFFALMDQLLAAAPHLDSHKGHILYNRLVAFARVFMRETRELEEAIRLCCETRRLSACYAFWLASSLSSGRNESRYPHRQETKQLTESEIEALIERILYDGDVGALQTVHMLSAQLSRRKPAHQAA